MSDEKWADVVDFTDEFAVEDEAPQGPICFESLNPRYNDVANDGVFLWSWLFRGILFVCCSCF